MIKDQICINTVSLLNDMLHKNDACPVELFRYTTDGYCQHVMFGDYPLWSGEDDGRKYIVDDQGEDTEELETLYIFLKREFNQYVDKLNRLKIK